MPTTELDQIRTTREAVHRSKRHASLRRQQTSVGHSARQALELRYLHHRGAHRPATAIEFVSEAPGIESEVLKTLRDRGWSVSDVVLTSFDRRMMKKARDCSKEVRLGLLVRDRHSYEEAVKDFLEIHADFLAPEESIIQSESDLHRAEECNVPVVPWPVNDEGRLRMFLSHGIVAGVITDNVPLALSVKRQL